MRETRILLLLLALVALSAALLHGPNEEEKVHEAPIGPDARSAASPAIALPIPPIAPSRARATPFYTVLYVGAHGYALLVPEPGIRVRVSYWRDGRKWSTTLPRSWHELLLRKLYKRGLQYRWDEWVDGGEHLGILWVRASTALTDRVYSRGPATRQQGRVERLLLDAVWAAVRDTASTRETLTNWLDMVKEEQRALVRYYGNEEDAFSPPDLDLLEDFKARYQDCSGNDE